MIRAIIIDDERHCIDRLSNLINMHCGSSVVLTGSFQTIDDGLRAIKELQPDLVFLDVIIHDATGFDLLKKLPEINFELIFTTAFDKYAVQAFKFSAVDYLLKPIDADDLKQAVLRIKEKLSKDDIIKRMDVLFHNLQQKNPKKISIPTLSGLTFLAVHDIIRCRSESNYTIIHLKNEQKITVSKTLKEFEELLAEYDFYRVHNSHLINLAYIQNYNKEGFVTMSDQSKVEVSTRRKEEFLKRLAEK